MTSHRIAGAVLVGMLALLVPACGSGASQSATTVAVIPGPYDFDYTIPLGTAARLARGEDIEVMPNELTAALGQTIRIVNLDTKSHEVGSWYVLAGSTLTYRFVSTGTFVGVCTTHPSGQFTLTVTN